MRRTLAEAGWLIPRTGCRWGLTIAFLVAIAHASLGQTRDLAVLEGEVRDAQGASIAGAHIALTQTQVGLRRKATTDASGRYAFKGLPITEGYNLLIEATGFRSTQKSGIALRANSTAYVEVSLRAGAEAQVVVYGAAGSVQTGVDEVGTRLGSRKIEETSIANNRVTSLALLSSTVRPAYTTGDLFTNESLFVVNGGGRRQTSWSIDNQNQNESWGRQTVFTSVPLVAIQEFELLSDALPAEYGWTTGAAVNIVTKAGEDSWHGDLLGAGRPAFSEASAPLAIKKAANTLAQGSGSISGPLGGRSTTFNAAAEFSDQIRAAVITSPLAFGSFFNGEFRQTLFFARVDHRLSENNHLTLRAFGDAFTDTNPSDGVSGTTLPTAARTFQRATYGVNLTDVATHGSNTLNELRLQFDMASPVTRFTPVIFGPQIFATGYYSYGDSRSANLMNHQFDVADTLTHGLGRHLLKAGVELLHSSSGGYGQEFGSGYIDGRFQVNAKYATLPIADVLASAPGAPPSGQPAGSPALVSTYTQAFGNQSYNVRELLTGAFVQDDWRATPDLTLNLGVRYEQQTFIGDNNNLAPRVGLAWRVPVSRPISVRAGYGIFYSEIRANQAANYELGDPRGVFSFTASTGQCGFPTSFTPWVSVQALLASPGCASNGSQSVPIRSITVALGQQDQLSRYFDVSGLRFYPERLLNPYTQQWNLGSDIDLGRNWILSADYVGTRGAKIERLVELNAPSTFVRTAPGQTRSVTAANATRPVKPAGTCTIASPTFDPAVANCFNNYSSVQTLANAADAYYEGLSLKLSRQLSTRVAALLTYTYSHVINTVEQDGSGGNPNDWNNLTEGERATGVLDQRHRAVLSGTYQMPMRFMLGGVAQMASGFPYNVVTGFDDNGDGSVTDRPIVKGALLPRDFGRGSPIYTLDTSLQKSFIFRDRVNISLRAEAFNVLNHPNYFSRNGTYGDGAAPSAVFGTPVGGLANTGASRQMQFLMRVRF